MCVTDFFRMFSHAFSLETLLNSSFVLPLAMFLTGCGAGTEGTLIKTSCSILAWVCKFASKQRNGPRPPTPLDESQPKTVNMHTQTEIRQHLAAGSAPSLLHDRGKAECGFWPCSPCGCHMVPFCLAPPEPVAEGEGSGLLRRAESHRQFTVQVRWPRLDEPESPPAASK